MPRLIQFLIALSAMVGLSPAIAADELPSAYEGNANAFLYNGKQNMPFVLYGVAIKWDKACRGGKVAHCMQLAAAFENGAGDLRADMRVAIAYYLLSCEKGSGPGCARAAAILRDGAAGFTNADLAQQMADRGCNALRNQDACAAMAASLAGNASGGDPARAAALADQACAGGSDEGCRIKAAALFYESTDAAVRAQALPMFERACQAKSAWGCLGLARAYAEGIGVARDAQRAAAFARTGCTEGKGDRLQLCTLHGSNLAASSDKAALNKGEQFLDASCRGGDPVACHRLGGIGMARQPGATTTLVEGVYYLRRGCDLGLGESCSALSAAYSSGVQVKRDEAVALALLEKGCRLGDPSGCEKAKQLAAASPGLRARKPAIDPALSVAEQLQLAKAAVAGGNQMDGVTAVVRLMQEGNEHAEWLLGGWLYYGLPGVFDQSRQQDGLILIENAARVGHVDAAVYMGMAYWYGDGVPEDRAKGENYMAIAAARGNEMAGAILRSMKAEPIRQDFIRREKEAAEAAKQRRVNWSSYWDNYQPGWLTSGFGSSSSSSSSSGRSVASIIDNSNWNQRINYLSGQTSACPASNPYC